MDRRVMSFAGFRIFAGSESEARNAVRGLVAAGNGGYVTFTGAHGIAETTRSAAVLTAHQRASIVFPDGVPLTWLARVNGIDMDQIAGPRFIERVLEDASDRGWRLYLFGASDKTLQSFVRRVGMRYPAVSIVGFESPPFGDPSDWPNRETLARIIDRQADVVFVALSTPKQELWMHAVESVYSVSSKAVFLGFGAAVDVMAGVQRPVPTWVQGSGLEWLYRMGREPKRLWRRYAFAVPKVIWLAIRRPARRG